MLSHLLYGRKLGGNFQFLLFGAGSARNFFLGGVGEDARLGRHLDRDVAIVMRKFFFPIFTHAYEQHLDGDHFGP